MQATRRIITGSVSTIKIVNPGYAGRLPKFDSSGSPFESLVCVNGSKFHAGETNGGNHRIIIPHQVGLQISYRVHPEVPPGDALSGVEEVLGGDV